MLKHLICSLFHRHHWYPRKDGETLFYQCPKCGCTHGHIVAEAKEEE